MRLARLLAVALAFLAGTGQAQLSQPDPDWTEVEVPRPAPLRTEGLIRIELPESTLRFGVDPASVAVGKDGVVRYVVVATSRSGAVNAYYEGVRCSSGAVKVYARHTPDRGWVPVKDSEWRSLHDSQPSRHSLVIARNGVCQGGSPNYSASQIVRDLRAGPEWRFTNN